MWRILVPVDGSEGALRAARHVAALAKQLHQCEACLINVQPTVPALDRAFDGRPSSVRSAQELLLREPGERIIAVAGEVLAQAGTACESRVEFGDAVHVIADYAQKLGADAIVMGAGRLDSATGRVLGSVASRIVNVAHVPVTLVK
ncbi:MAG: universal stress protein [Burkholderiales bacterium]|nr:universal stress protein [Burkholderiales bacterium]